MKKEELKILVDLWYESTYGYYKKCNKKHYELMQILHKLHDGFYKEKG